MMHRRARAVAIAVGMAGALLSTPSESKALFDWFGCGGCGLFGRTTYRPLFSGAGCCPQPACNPCATQTCNYVPQTCYRTECVNVPVTTYRPCQTCDPCTGCPVTTYRPVTTFVRQVRQVPVTSYRPVCTTSCAPVCAPAPACAPVAAAPVATSYYPTTLLPAAPATVLPAAPTTVLPAAPAPNCCTPAATTLSPGAGYGMPTSPGIQSTLPPTNVPSLPGGSNVPQTFDPNSTPMPQNELKAIPEQNLNGPAGASTTPWYADPHSRTTALPRTLAPTRSNLVVPALYVTPAANQGLDDGGWRAARRPGF